jgi:hypothetical protein
MSEDIMEAIERGVVPTCRQPSKKKQRNNNNKNRSTSVSSSSLINGSESNTSSPESSSRGNSPSPVEPSRRQTRKRIRSNSTLFSLNENGETTTATEKGIDADIDDDPTGMYCGGVLKPAVTFFGETLSDNVTRKIESDRKKVDALIVIGTSLSVAPISKVIEYLPCNIPRILINRTIVHPATTPASHQTPDDDNDEDEYKDFRDNYVFDAYLLGYCDDVTRALARRLFNDTTSNSKEIVLKTVDNKKKRRITSSTEQDIRGSVQNQYCAGLLTSVLEGKEDNWNAEEWSSCNVDVPTERVLLFPGALASRDDTSSEMDYREIAHCDGCSKRIHGIIEKCVNCFDFDLCQTCFPSLSKTHFDGTHSFSAENAAP